MRAFSLSVILGVETVPRLDGIETGIVGFCKVGKGGCEALMPIGDFIHWSSERISAAF